MVEVACKTSMKKIDMTEDSLTVQVSLKGRDEVEDNHYRAPVAITVVVDTSSSMYGQPLHLVQKACRFILKNCRAGDMIGLVQYDFNANQVFPLTETSESFTEYACFLVNKMKAQGPTHMHDGIMLGLDQQKNKKYRRIKFDDAHMQSIRARNEANHLKDTLLFRGERSRGSASTRGMKQRKSCSDEIEEFPYDEFSLPADCVQSVFLFTDGMANKGPVKEDLVNAVKNMLQQSGPIKMNTFGFGSDHDEKMMVELCETCDGKYYYMKSEEEIPAAFADAIGGLQSLAAEKLMIEITPKHDFTVADVCTKGTSMQSTSKEGTFTVSCGSVVCGACKDLLFKVTVPRERAPVAGNGQLEIAAVKVSGMDVQSAGAFTVTQDVTVERVQALSAEERDSLQDLDVAYQCVRLDLLHVLENAENYAESGEYELAQNHLKEFTSRIASFLHVVQEAGRRDIFNLVLFLQTKLKDAIEDCDVGHGRTRGGNMKSMRMRNRAMKMQSNDCRDDETDDEDGDDGLSMAKGGSKRQRTFRSSAKTSDW